MADSVRVFAGVTVRRAVAAKRDAAFLASPQMDPVCAGLHAFFAFAALRLFDRRDRIDVGTGRHTSLPLFAQHLMHGGHGDRSFPNGRGNAFHIAGTHVADREHSGQTARSPGAYRPYFTEPSTATTTKIDKS
jgi:hypothetical protein